ncbi:MAG: VWA domain-containing protein [Candidatus Omnitrophica bacterium]|nr:VWA domain-containing protein [Candidatus Omnitrophota bacterium]
MHLNHHKDMDTIKFHAVCFGSHKGQRGVIALAAITLIALLAIGALAVDLAYLYTSKGELQNAADAAALAGVGAIWAGSESAIDEAKEFAAKHWAADDIVELQDSNILTGEWSFAEEKFTANVVPPNAIQVRASRDADAKQGKIGLFFARILGMQDIALSATSTAAIGGRNIVMCLDRSKSMEEGSGIKDEDGKELKLIELLEKAAIDFANDLETSLADDRIGVVYYHSFAWDYIRTMKDPGTQHSQIVDDIHGGAWADWPDGIGGPPDKGWTCISCGMNEAWKELASDRATHWGVRVMIIMTDGHPNLILDPPGDVGEYAMEHSIFINGAEANRDAREEILELAQKIADEGIVIYTIGLGLVNRTLLEDVAEIGGGKAYFVSSAHPEELDDAFESIAEKIPIILAK